ncbi:MAG: serine/threonine protein kinase [Nitrosomonas sp.]|uniref:serine/threonine protein kinase n=1 Tax=Nitrosomonas sp. TaxID=42353 RepID=UPI0025E5AAD9|nr:serine/threonine protein kinase [Nitrosomonas sp.]MBY0475818.1 serine/threonine protein kinase [Nitrosomonas sp.]
MTTPAFSLLTPDCVMNALDSFGYHCDGHLLALNSYENRVYQVGMEEDLPLIVKFYRPGRWTDEAILEEHTFMQELADREIPVVPALIVDGKTLHSFEGFRFAVFTRHGGRPPEFEGRNTLEWMGRFLGRIHAIGAIKPFQHRPTLDIASFGDEPLHFLLSNSFIPADLDAAYRSVAEQALSGVRYCFERAGSSVKALRLHGDCYAGNVLWTDNGPHFVDFDDSRMGPAIQDLWMLLSGDHADMARQLNDALVGYEDFYDFDLHELHLIEALRTLRLIHYSAWLAQRWDDLAFKQAFPWFNTQRYWQERILELREQIALMSEPPLRLV